jgi:hypothetical protein
VRLIGVLGVRGKLSKVTQSTCPARKMHKLLKTEHGLE